MSTVRYARKSTILGCTVSVCVNMNGNSCVIFVMTFIIRYRTIKRHYYEPILIDNVV